MKSSKAPKAPKPGKPSKSALKQAHDPRETNRQTYADFVMKLNHISDTDIERALAERSVQLSLR